MERKSVRRKLLRRKYKRYAAAVAGAAILTGAVLPGIPVAKASAAERPYSPSTKTVQATSVDKNHQKSRHSGWHEHKNSWPSSDENQAWYEDGKIYYRSDRYRDYNRDRDYYHWGYVNYLSSPVEFAKNYAATYGFDRNLDTFSLLSQSNNKAYVEVVKHDTGQLGLMVLERDRDHDWRIVAVRR
jgi:hypothetical protein